VRQPLHEILPPVTRSAEHVSVTVQAIREELGHRVEEMLLAMDMAVERHRLHTEHLPETPHRQRPQPMLVDKNHGRSNSASVEAKRSVRVVRHRRPLPDPPAILQRYAYRVSLSPARAICLSTTSPRGYGRPSGIGWPEGCGGAVAVVHGGSRESLNRRPTCSRSWTKLDQKVAMALW